LQRLLVSSGQDGVDLGDGVFRVYLALLYQKIGGAGVCHYVVVLEAVIQKQGQSVEGNHVPLSNKFSKLLTQFGCTKNSLMVLASSAEYLFQIRVANFFEGHMNVKGDGEHLFHKSRVICQFRKHIFKLTAFLID
jgi:hypothetical protein